MKYNVRIFVSANECKSKRYNFESELPKWVLANAFQSVIKDNYQAVVELGYCKKRRTVHLDSFEQVLEEVSSLRFHDVVHRVEYKRKEVIGKELFCLNFPCSISLEDGWVTECWSRPMTFFHLKLEDLPELFPVDIKLSFDKLQAAFKKADLDLCKSCRGGLWYTHSRIHIEASDFGQLRVYEVNIETEEIDHYDEVEL